MWEEGRQRDADGFVFSPGTKAYDRQGREEHQGGPNNAAQLKSLSLRTSRSLCDLGG